MLCPCCARGDERDRAIVDQWGRKLDSFKQLPSLNDVEARVACFAVCKFTGMQSCSQFSSKAKRLPIPYQPSRLNLAHRSASYELKMEPTGCDGYP